MTNSNLQLSGQVIAITAADRGFSRVIAQGLAAVGATLVLIGKQSEILSGMASTIEKQNTTVIPMQADISLTSDWLKVQNRTLDIFGALHGIVHSADKSPVSTEINVEEAEWIELFNNNIKSSINIQNGIKESLPETWLTIIGPHLDDKSLQTEVQRGALKGLVKHASLDYRCNILLPSRSPCGDDKLDIPIVNTILALADQKLSHLNGFYIDINLEQYYSSEEEY